ncbi:putative AC transposase [Bienertia sinuspersici]
MESTHQDPITIESDDEVNSDGTEPPTKPKEAKTIKIKPNLIVNPLKRQRNLTSSIWVEFEMIDELDASGKIQCKCKKSGVKYIAESSHGTGNMRRHIKGCKGRVYRDVGQLLLRSNVSGSVEVKPYAFKLDEFRELLSLAITRHNLPLQLVEYEGIRNCFAYLNPEVKFISRHTIKNDISKMYTKEKSKLKDLLQCVPGRIALTSDC